MHSRKRKYKMLRKLREHPLWDKIPHGTPRTRRAYIESVFQAYAQNERTARRAQAICMRYGLGMRPHRYKEIAGALGVSLQRSGQLVTHGFADIASRL